MYYQMLIKNQTFAQLLDLSSTSLIITSLRDEINAIEVSVDAAFSQKDDVIFNELKFASLNKELKCQRRVSQENYFIVFAATSAH